MIVAEMKKVSKVYGERRVLDNVDLQLQEGEILGLLGPNGSGKTTILKILAFIESPSAGEVEFEGEVVNFKKTEKTRLRSTLIFQRTVLFSTSVYNNVAYGLRIRKVPKAIRDEEVRKALRIVRLEGFENRPARRLSGGEQQRVAIARGLVLKTKLFLLDEPTANLDPKNAAILEEVITTVNRQMKTTIVMATHNMFQAKILPNRIALINGGRITEVGSPKEIFGKISRNLASFVVLDNTFRGNAKTADAGITVVDVGNNVKIETAISKEGDVNIFISPEDIILSKNGIVTSARNVFKGRITTIENLNPLVRLTVDAGKPFVVQITMQSFTEMGLNLDAEVFIAFKASSVHIV